VQYNQLINGHPYQLQQEYSNAQVGCMSSIPLTADFTGAPTSPITTGQQITLSGSASNETGGTITAYAWNFGDGSSVVTGATAAHTYTTAGVYTVKLTVTDSKGFSDYKTSSVTVNTGDELPTAAFSVTTAPQVLAQPVSFDASASSDADGTISSYAWNFGDGSGAGAKPSHAYAADGTYTVALTVTDSSGLTATTTHQITVAAPPNAAFSVTTQTPAQGQPVAFDASASSDPAGTISAYAWNFGDGSAAPGTYTVTLTVTDNSGLTASATHQVSVDELPTAAIVVKTARPASGVPVAFDGARSSDPDGALAYQWNFGDGSATAAGVAPRHTYRDRGSYLASLVVTDGAGLRASTSRWVQVALGGKITKISAQTSHRGRFLTVQLNAPGKLSVGSRTVTVHRPQKCSFRIRLSGSQLSELRHRHALKMRFTVEFVPVAGDVTHQTATVTLHH
jgi:PKD repeat protein